MKDLEWVLEGGRPPTPDALRAAGRLTSGYLVRLTQRHPGAWARIEVWLKANNVTAVVV